MKDEKVFHLRLPVALWKRIKDVAATERRSFTAQVVVLLEQAVSK